MNHDVKGMKELTERVSELEPCDLDQLQKVKLLDRDDTKFIFHRQQLLQVLNRLPAGFKILEIQGQRLFNYQTRYFDTVDRRLYHDHHNGLRPRFKVRFRRYPLPETFFLEIKRKNNRDRTIKERMLTEEIPQQISNEAAEFVRAHSPLFPDDLVPSLDVGFTRLTLVNPTETDRITIDFDLEAHSMGSDAQFPDLVIAEVKQPRLRPSSSFFTTCHALGVQSMRLSKYCVGILHTCPGLKYNRYKPKLRRVQKIMTGQSKLETTYV